VNLSPTIFGAAADSEEPDDPYSIEQLRDPRMNLSVVRPLVDKFYELKDVSISKLYRFCLENYLLKPSRDGH
jgi:hypothetical protein